MEWIDTHAHIYLPDFDADRAALLQRASAAGVGRVLLPAIDASTHGRMLETETAFPFCRAMMGLHPCSVKADFREELRVAEDHLRQRPFIAVGEIGLDFYWDTTFALQQQEAFEIQIGWALERGLPIVIHSRNATDECIATVEKYPGLAGVFHCFSGTAEQAERISRLGFLLGIGGVVTYKNAGLDKVIEKVGISSVVLETDAPYLSPVPYRGKRNESSYLRQVAAKISALTGLEEGEVARITTQNAINLFKLS